MVASKLILVKRDDVDQSEMLLDCAEHTIKERLNGLRYHSKQKVLFVSGATSFFLMGFDDTGLSYSRTLSCNRFGRAVRLLGWDPQEEFILIAQRTMGSQERYHLIDYRAADPIFASFLNGQSFLGSCYDSINHRLFYIEAGSDQRKDIRFVNLEGFREKYCLIELQNDCDIELDAEY